MNNYTTNFESGRVEIYPIEKVPEIISQIIRLDLFNTADEDFVYGEIYEHQLFYLKRKHAGSFFVAAFGTDRQYLGGVVLFLKAGAEGVNPDPPVFQAIAKSLHGRKSSIKLNSMLVPAIVQFLSEKGYSEVRVEPYEKQKKILAKHYGFVEGHFGEMKLEW